MVGSSWVPDIYRWSNKEIYKITVLPYKNLHFDQKNVNNFHYNSVKYSFFNSHFKFKCCRVFRVSCQLLVTNFCVEYRFTIHNSTKLRRFEPTDIFISRLRRLILLLTKCCRVIVGGTGNNILLINSIQW